MNKLSNINKITLLLVILLSTSVIQASKNQINFQIEIEQTQSINILFLAGDIRSRSNETWLQLTSWGIISDIFYLDSGTPLLTDLTPYFLIIIETGMNLPNATQIGDVLALYMDQGGKLIQFAYSFITGFEIQGAWSNYSTIETAPWINLNEKYTGNATHRIFNGVANISSFSSSTMVLTSGAEVLGSYDSGTPFVIQKGNVLLINIWLHNSGFLGDLNILLINGIDYLFDSDGDGLTDNEELVYGTDPDLADTDGDGWSDYDEITEGTDPLDPNDNPGLLLDSDGDGLTNGEELVYGTDPNLADTDGDKINDYDEIMVYHTDPNLADTDGDTISDYDEIMVFLTDPNLADTDGDGIDDYDEIDNGSDPLDPNDPNPSTTTTNDTSSSTTTTTTSTDTSRSTSKAITSTDFLPMNLWLVVFSLNLAMIISRKTKK